MRGGSAKKVVVALGAGLLLSMGAVAVADEAATSGPVTLVNQSNHPIKVWAKYGSDERCEAQPKTTEINIAAGESQTVDVTTKACVCLEVPERNMCPSGYQMIKAGAKRIFR
jgi:hypothetical protein